VQLETTGKLTPADTRTTVLALLPSWRRHMRAVNLAPRTVQSYLETAQQFAAYLLTAALPHDVAAIRRPHVEQYLEHLAAHYRPATAAIRYRSLRQFFRWAVEEGEVLSSPMAGLRQPRVPEQPVPVLADNDLRRLLADCGGRSFEDRRDAAMFRLFIDTGTRLAEVMALTVTDVDLDTGLVVVMGKGRRRRVVPVGAQTTKALDRYLSLRLNLRLPS